jgi:hypothetical protein
MKKNRKDETVSELCPEYDFSSGERGKYAPRFAEGSNVVVLDPDVVEIFGDSQSVNQALRTLAHSARRKRKDPAP